MTSGSDGSDNGYRPPTEPNFADVVNAFSFDSGRGKRRKWGRRRGQDVAYADASTTEPATTGPSPPGTPHAEWAGEVVGQPEPEPQEAAVEGAAAVRPYTWTRGRTKSGFDLAVETLLSTSQRGREQVAMLPIEHRAVAHLCEQTRSVAEVAALLTIPLGVARVLLGDMAGLGLVVVHQSVTGAGNPPDLALMERVLSGLRRL